MGLKLKDMAKWLNEGLTVIDRPNAHDLMFTYKPSRQFAERIRVNNAFSAVRAHVHGNPRLEAEMAVLHGRLVDLELQLIEKNNEIGRLRAYRYNARKAYRALQASYERARGMVAMKWLDRVVAPPSRLEKNSLKEV